jgi:hypothetical protein
MNRQNHNSMHQRLRGRRKGFSTVFSLLMMVSGIALVMLVVNFTYLMTVNRHSLQLTDTLSRSAVVELLDENVLRDQSPDQSDDIDDAQQAILAPGTGLLALNNAATGARLQAHSDGDNTYNPATDDVNVFAGRVDDASSPAVVGNFTTSPGSELFNTLVAEVLRKPGSLNPVEILLQGFNIPNQVKISAATYATLDSRVIGFRPATLRLAPVAPLAIDASAWAGRAGGGLDSYPPGMPNGRRELDVRLLTTGGSGTANGALVDTNDSNSMVTYSQLAGQVQNGVSPAQVDGSTGLLGPATVGTALILAADRVTPAPELNSLVAAFNAVAISDRPQRVFPLYATVNSSSASIVGFIAARVIEAEAEGNNQLRVRIEPDFIVHPTVETRRYDPTTSADVPENKYIHKIRITR